LFAHQRKKIQLLYAIADAILTVAAFQIAYLTRVELNLARTFYLRAPVHLLLLGFCALVWIASGWLQRTYEYLDSSHTLEVVVNALKQTAVAGALLVLFQYLLRLDLSRSFLCIFLLCNLWLLIAFRCLSPQLIGMVQRGFGSPYHLVLVGSPLKTQALAGMLCRSTPFKLAIVAQLAEESCRRELPALLADQIVDEVIFSVEGSHLTGLEDVFLQCDEQGVRTRVAANFFPHVNSDITLDRVGGVPLLTFSAAPLDSLHLVFKRTFDVVVSLLALILLAPLFAVVAILIKLTSPGPVIFRQSRCGLNGRRFTMLKFRSMVREAAAMQSQVAHLNEREVAFKIAGDPRITPLGRWLRRFSVDELPQLLNVLAGDMSIVGPRPPLPEEVKQYQPWQRRRLRMRPGLTCLWAVAGRDSIDFNAWMKMDISYIENWSLGLDWSIILKTIPQVIAGRGAH
jgi:exopolysaccharide biosynthesis polyprenyl glycosylphosphotransferase